MNSMEPRHGKGLARGTSWTFVSKVFKPDEQQMKNLLLNIMAVVGFIFLALALLHLSHSMPWSHSFHIYMAIFLFLEGVFISVQLYNCLRRRSYMSLDPVDVETTFTVAEKSDENNHSPHV